MRYRVVGGRLEVTARSGLHDATLTCDAIAGHAAFDRGRLERLEPDPDAALELEVDLRGLRGSGLVTAARLRADLDLDVDAIARYRLAGLEVATSDGGDRGGVARGALRWRDREVEVTADGTIDLEPDGFTAHARFALDVRRLGVTPPRVLFFKVADVVDVAITVRGRAVG